MLFNSFGYLVFLPVIVILYWLLPIRARRPLLLVASYYFYMSWIPAYGLLIFPLTVANFGLGKWLSRANNPRAVLTLALIINLSVLGFFKYLAFLTGIVIDAIAPLGMTLQTSWSAKIILPLGISFFTFEFIHYLVDIYRGNKPIPSFIDFALFPAFFPTQIAGPIKRYEDFIPQLHPLPVWNNTQFQSGIGLIVRGLFKKVVLADSMAVVANIGFGSSLQLGFVDAWITIIAFAFQIYFDFSGYTDIGRGSALLMGFKVPENFNLPYFATNISEFWRRWHITLSQWLRDYIYIPLGGSRGSQTQTYLNLFITMTLGGLWHGAAWTFVIWGMYHGLLLIAYRQVKQLTAGFSIRSSPALTKVSALMSILFTFVLVCVGWVFFRSESIGQAYSMIWRMFGGASEFIGSVLNNTQIAETLAVASGWVLFVYIANWLMSAERSRRITQNRWLLVSGYYAMLVVAIILFQPQTSATFIYFQF